MVCPCRPYHFKFLKGCLLQIYLVHSWILWSTYKAFWGIISLVAIVPILYPRKNQKTKGFLVFSEGIKWGIDHKMVKKLRDQCSHFIILENTRKTKVSSSILGLAAFPRACGISCEMVKKLLNQCFHFILLENTRKPKVSWCFLGLVFFWREGGGGKGGIKWGISYETVKKLREKNKVSIFITLGPGMTKFSRR